MQFSKFLRTILKLDAASCLGMGAAVLLFAGSLSGPLGIGTGILQAAAASLIPIGLFIAGLASRRSAPAGLVWLVILGNVGWTAMSFATASSLPGITPLGQAAVAGQALAVLALTISEWVGLRSSQRAIWKAA